MYGHCFYPGEKVVHLEALFYCWLVTGLRNHPHTGSCKPRREEAVIWVCFPVKVFSQTCTFTFAEQCLGLIQRLERDSALISENQQTTEHYGLGLNRDPCAFILVPRCFSDLVWGASLLVIEVAFHTILGASFHSPLLPLSHLHSLLSLLLLDEELEAKEKIRVKILNSRAHLQGIRFNKNVRHHFCNEQFSCLLSHVHVYQLRTLWTQLCPFLPRVCKGIPSFQLCVLKVN